MNELPRWNYAQWKQISNMITIKFNYNRIISSRKQMKTNRFGRFLAVIENCGDLFIVNQIHRGLSSQVLSAIELFQQIP